MTMKLNKTEMEFVAYYRSRGYTWRKIESEFKSLAHSSTNTGFTRSEIRPLHHTTIMRAWNRRGLVARLRLWLGL